MRRFPGPQHTAGVRKLGRIAVAGIVPAAGVAAAPAAGAAVGPAVGPVSWGVCPPATAGSAPTPPPRDPREECAAVTVPLDYRHPGGATITVEISRIRTSRPGERRGDLVLLPGGPGGSGLEQPTAALTALPAAVLDHYDVYGLDYRGIGNSSPVDCGISAADRAAENSLPFPAPDGDISANVAYAQRIAADCAAHGGPELPFITTANTARDLDRIRTALGEEKLSLYGTSYGTYLGAVYAQLFPQRVDHLVLNSTVAPGGVAPALPDKAIGVEQAFTAYAPWAAAQDAVFHLGATPAAVRAAALAAESALDTDPLPLTPQLSLTGNALRLLVESLLEQPAWFPELSELLEIATTRQVPAGGTGIGSTLPVALTVSDNFLSAQDAVVCGDTASVRSPAFYAARVRQERQRYPLTAGAPGNIWPCAFWPRPVEPPVTLTGHGPRDILMLQNAVDPSTPYSGAVRTRRALGQRAQLVTMTSGIGHGIPLTTPCPADAVTAFLLGAPLPPRDTTCP
jgi:pimeloyl-ACP methyl ester carboxylesterase